MVYNEQWSTTAVNKAKSKKLTNHSQLFFLQWTVIS